MSSVKKFLTLCFVLMFGPFVSNATNANCMCSRQADSLVLVKLYNETQGSSWVVKWNLSMPMTSWFGLTLDNSFCVRNITLINNNLNGPLPAEIGQLSNLKILNLFGNKISSSIPSTIGSLNSLEELVLDDNVLTGSIPSSIGSLSALHTLSLRSNFLTGTIPISLYNLTGLFNLILSRNQLSGGISPNIGLLINLNLLDLSGNILSGNIPSNISNLTKLTELYLHENQFNGSLPSSMSGFTKLRNVWLNNNQFVGSVPDLRSSPLGSLRINSNDFSDIPDYSTVRTWGSNAPFGLDIRNNKFTFEDLIPLKQLPSQYYYAFSPQDTILIDPIHFVPKNGNYTIRLFTDPSISDNNYKWYHDTALVFISNINEFNIIQAEDEDEGVYSARITNAALPGFELNVSESRVVLTDPTKCDSPLAGDFCSNAGTLCGTIELNNYCGALSIPDTNMTKSFFCDSSSILDNPKWLSFVATQDTLELEIFPINCTTVIKEGNEYKGLQAALWTSCEDDHQVLFCQSECKNSSFKIGGGGFIIGQRYSLVLDGCGGSICEYLIKVIRGKDIFNLSDPVRIIGRQAFCPDNEDHIFSTDKIAGAHSYQWYINDSLFQTTTDSFVNIKNFNPGIYQIKVRGLSNCDSTNFSSLIFQIHSQLSMSKPIIIKYGRDSIFKVFFKISGGNPPYRMVNGAGDLDSLNGDFESVDILCNSAYQFEILDNKNCVVSLTGFESCGCGSYAGLLPTDTLNFCEGQNFSIQAPPGTIRDTGDVSAFIIFTDKLNPKSSTIKISKSGLFAFDPQLFKMNIPFYVAYVISRPSQSGQINLNHPCVAISSPQTIYFRAEPLYSTTPDKTYCEFDVQIGGFGNHTSGIWKFVSGPKPAVIDSPLLELTTIHVDTFGVYVFSREVVNEFCKSKDDITLTFREPKPLAINGSLFVCPGQKTKLVASDSFSLYLWDHGESSRTIFVDTPGTYCITAFDADNCRSRNCIKLDSSVAPFPNVKGPDSICTKRTDRVFTNQQFVSYLWNTNDTSSSIQIDTGGLYCVTVTAANGCTGTDCIFVESKQRSVLYKTDTACAETQYTFDGKSYSVPGQYEHVVNKENQYQCDSVVLLTLRAFPKIILLDSFILDDNGSSNGSISVFIRGGKPPYKIRWSNNDTTATISKLKAGNYTLTVMDQNGCLFVKTFTVKLNTSSSDFESKYNFTIFPNPGNSTSNLLLQYPDPLHRFTLFILNSQSQLVYQNQFETKKIGNPLVLNLELTPGVYYYIIQYKNQQKVIKKLIIQ